MADEHVATLTSWIDETPVARGRLVDGRLVVDEVFDAAAWERFVAGRFALDVVVDGGDPVTMFAAPQDAGLIRRTWTNVFCKACGRHVGEWAGGVARFRCCRCKARTIWPWPPPPGTPIPPAGT